MRVYYDTEFVDDGERIHLISIGMIAEDGRTYYAVNRDLNLVGIAASPWLRQHVWPVLPKIPGEFRRQALAGVGWRNRLTRDPVLRTALVLTRLFNRDHADCKYPRRIAIEVENFLRDSGAVELWSWYAAYDHVALAQLWGPMAKLPDRVPMYTRDLQQEADRIGFQIPDEDTPLHHALWCAQRHMRIGQQLQNLDISSPNSPVDYPGRPGDWWMDADRDVWVHTDDGVMRLLNFPTRLSPMIAQELYGPMGRVPAGTTGEEGQADG